MPTKHFPFLCIGNNIFGINPFEIWEFAGKEFSFKFFSISHELSSPWNGFLW